MDKYYYFASQLPLLKFNQRTYLDLEGFLTEAQKWLGQKELSILSQVGLDNFYSKKNEPEILKKYKDFERSLREEVASFRKPDEQLSEYKSSGLFSTQLLAGTPLAVEQNFLFARWQFIEELEDGHYFDLEFLILYFLKLKVLERLFTFDKPKGTVVFDKLCEVNL